VAAVGGGVAAACSLGVGELVAGLSLRVPSLVVSVADVVVAEAPGGFVRWSIDTFGASQKSILVTGTVVVSLLLGAWLGVVAVRRPVIGALGFAGFGFVGGLAAGRDSLTADGWGWLAAVIATGVGIGALTLLVPRGPAVELGAVEPIGAPERRRFLALSSTFAFIGVVSGGMGWVLRQARHVEAARARVASRLGAGPPVVPSDVEVFDEVVAGISPIVTPNADFYRIDTRILVPQIDPDDWSLRITGMVDRPVELGFDELLSMTRITQYVTLQCVSNEVGGDLVGNALWSGVPVVDLLERAGVHADATQVVGRSVDGWTAGFPIDVVTDGRPCMVALAMNGEPLPIVHGFPARLVVPGLYGYVSATKWLSEIELTTWEGFDGYWVPRGWSKEGPIKTQSRIDVPRSGAAVRAGPVAVAGVAWAPTRSVERVEVRVDGEPWRPARLSGQLSENTWVQWVLTWDAEPGDHELAVRATDGNGEPQTAERAAPAPSGATGHHTIRVTVA
jgi:DMSO/TMAO reductase YedYZ molybdopterin-dependent catalytic subunit